MIYLLELNVKLQPPGGDEVEEKLSCSGGLIARHTFVNFTHERTVDKLDEVARTVLSLL